jgi:endonuclease YncB( thermonuclease family)
MRILVVLLIFLAGPALAIEMCDSGKRVTCVVDGDTLWFRGEKIRMMGYDTPEAITGICGGQKEIRLAARASKRLVQLLNQNTFTIERDGKDKYGRTLAVIRISGRNVGDILIAEGLARSWPDGQEFWCE